MHASLRDRRRDRQEGCARRFRHTSESVGAACTTSQRILLKPSNNCSLLFPRKERKALPVPRIFVFLVSHVIHACCAVSSLPLPLACIPLVELVSRSKLCFLSLAPSPPSNPLSLPHPSPLTPHPSPFTPHPSLTPHASPPPPSPSSLLTSSSPSL